MSKKANCTDEAPVSEIYLSEVSLAEQICIAIATALTLAVLLLFVDKVWFILRHYRSHSRVQLVKHKSMWLVGLYPVVALDSLLAIYIPRARLLCDLVSAVYLATCLSQFTTLIILYFGGSTKMLDRLNKSTTPFNLRAPPLSCCCFCCPAVPASSGTLKRVRQLVLQTAFLQPVLSFISIVLYLDGKYDPDVTKPGSLSSIFGAVGGVSTLLAMYGMVILFRSSRKLLSTHNITSKFFVLQLELVFLNLQSLILRLLADAGIPPCRGRLSSSVRGDSIQHMLLIFETFLLAVGARVVYRKPLMHEKEDQDLDTSRESLETSPGSVDTSRESVNPSRESTDTSRESVNYTLTECADTERRNGVSVSKPKSARPSDKDSLLDNMAPSDTSGVRNYRSTEDRG